MPSQRQFDALVRQFQGRILNLEGRMSDLEGEIGRTRSIAESVVNARDSLMAAARHIGAAAGLQQRAIERDVADGLLDTWPKVRKTAKRTGVHLGRQARKSARRRRA